MISPIEILLGWICLASFLLIVYFRQRKTHREEAFDTNSQLQRSIERERKQIMNRKRFLDRYDLEHRNLEEALVAQIEIDLSVSDRFL
jgi:hypothetical protein